MQRKVINNAATIKEFKGQYIVGSIDKSTGTMSISANPVSHVNHGDALAEAARLAKLDSGKKYVILTIGMTASIQDVVFE